MIIQVSTKKDLKRFIYFVKDLYKDDPHYIYPLFSIIFKEFKKIILDDMTYKAILSVNSDNVIQGRLLYTIEHNTKEEIDICYWSYFDCIESMEVSSELFNHMEQDMKKSNVTVSEGSFTPYDPDNRRGILIDGFDSDPIIFTSYNKQYYPTLLEDYGYEKYRDTFSVIPVENEEHKERLEKYARFFERRFKVNLDYINFKNVEKEIKDIHEILSESDHEVIYQETPTIDKIRDVAQNLRLFLDKRIIIIAREAETKKPIAFAFCLLDFNQVFKKTKGRIMPIRILFYKRKITKARGMMQYVIPKYQGTGITAYIYRKIYQEFKKMGITDFEGGTMMEDNMRSLTSFAKFGGDKAKTFRIYRKVINI